METEQLDLTFAALADPTRRATLTGLAKGEATVGELANRFFEWIGERLRAQDDLATLGEAVRIRRPTARPESGAKPNALLTHTRLAGVRGPSCANLVPAT
jgi:DNA-binding transcriptional ArsR family regulator